jgi:uncharacterized membrane protein
VNPAVTLPRASSRKGRKEGNYLSSKAGSVDLRCSSGKACQAHDPGAVISFLCALCVLCVNPAVTLPRASSRKGRKEGNYLSSKAGSVDLWCSPGKACQAHTQERLSLFFAPCASFA